MGNKIIQEDIEFIYNSNLPWNEFRSKTILITGANGFIASYMVETLLHLNEKIPEQFTKVIALVRNIDKATVRFKMYLERPDFKLLIQDVSDTINIDEKIDYIIHAASQASPKYYSIDPVGTLSANVFGTANILNLAKKNNVQSVLFFSSSEIYGNVVADSNPVNESDFGYLDPSNVRACYAESKRNGREYVCKLGSSVWFKYKYCSPFSYLWPDDGFR
jgi:UDP-glucuronate decarboxylase